MLKSEEIKKLKKELKSLEKQALPLILKNYGWDKETIKKKGLEESLYQLQKYSNIENFMDEQYEDLARNDRLMNRYKQFYQEIIDVAPFIKRRQLVDAICKNLNEVINSPIRMRMDNNFYAHIEPTKSIHHPGFLYLYLTLEELLGGRLEEVRNIITSSRVGGIQFSIAPTYKDQIGWSNNSYVFFGKDVEGIFHFYQYDDSFWQGDVSGESVLEAFFTEKSYSAEELISKFPDDLRDFQPIIAAEIERIALLPPQPAAIG